MTRILSWRRTRIGGELQPDDYVGEDPERPIVSARIYLAASMPSGRNWFWTISAEKQIASGLEFSEKAAADAVESAYLRWKDIEH